MEIVRKALLGSADCADAYFFLAEVTAGTLQEAIDFYRQGVGSRRAGAWEKSIRNKHVPHYLLGRKKVPRNLPGHYGIGDQNEAVLYASGNHEVWRSTPGALEWLAAKVK